MWKPRVSLEASVLFCQLVETQAGQPCCFIEEEQDAQSVGCLSRVTLGGNRGNLEARYLWLPPCIREGPGLSPALPPDAKCWTLFTSCPLPSCKGMARSFPVSRH